MSINGVLLTETVFQPFINRVINTVMNKSVNKQMEQLFTRYPSLRGIGENLHRAYSILEKTFFNSGTLFVCGNGGSASDAEHIVGELMKNFLRKRPMPEGEKKIFREVLGPGDISSKLQMGFRAVCLNGHPALSSAYANDVDPLMAYAQQLYVLGKEGDAFIGISTSGNAVNVLNALKVARVKKISSILLTGENHGICEPYADCLIKVPLRETYQIQELHLPIYHALCLMIEERFYGNNEEE